MKKLFFSLCAVGLSCAAFGAGPEASIVPKPLSVTPGAGTFTVTASTVIGVGKDAELRRSARIFAGEVAPVVGGVMKTAAGGDIRLAVDGSLEAEAYTLAVTPSGVEVRGGTPQGVFYGLQSLQDRVQNEHGNYTRFICIAAKPEVYPGADRTSLLVTLANEPGSLYQVLARIYGFNLTKLESRPIPGSDDTFRFYFDLEASVYSPELPKLLGELESVCEHVCYLGSYSETV